MFPRVIVMVVSLQKVDCFEFYTGRDKLSSYETPDHQALGD